ncbi:MAG: type II toxin-antitoxin system HipA family toxin [Pseudomonadota bacterium]
MTSDTWVWIHLPGALKPTLCGVIRHAAGVGRFVYGKSYLGLQGAVPIDPVALPLQEKEYATAHLGGWFSALLDSGPDAWGQRLIDRHVGPQDSRGYLLHAYGEPVGALTFSATATTPPQTTTATRIQSLAHTLALHARVEAGEALSSAETLQLLGQAGTGGARPKLTLEDGGVMWLAKGVSIKDKADLAPVPIVEAALLSLAGELNIRSTPARLETIGGSPVVLVPRFDRAAVDVGFSRWRYVSGQTLLRSEPGVAQWSFQGSYNNLARQLSKWEASPREDIRELYRRLAFNALVGNLDDHEKNHGLVAGADGTFRLTPVFDLSITATAGERQMLAMAFGKNGALITLDNLLSDCTTFGYALGEAEAILRGHWEHLQKHALERLVQLGCGEAVAARTVALMPGHRVFPDMKQAASR